MPCWIGSYGWSPATVPPPVMPRLDRGIQDPARHAGGGSCMDPAVEPRGDSSDIHRWESSVDIAPLALRTFRQKLLENALAIEAFPPIELVDADGEVAA